MPDRQQSAHMILNTERTFILISPGSTNVQTPAMRFVPDHWPLRNSSPSFRPTGLVPCDEFLHTIRFAHGPRFAQQPPVHSRKITLALAQFGGKQGHALDEARV